MSVVKCGICLARLATRNRGAVPVCWWCDWKLEHPEGPES